MREQRIANNAGRTASTRRRKTQRGGGTLLEGALVLLTLLTMIIFVVEMGRMLVFQQMFTERAREGARSAIVSNYNSTTVQNFVLYNSATAPGGSTTGFFGLTASEVTVTRLGTAGTWNDRVQVTISNYPMFDFVPLLSHSYTVPPITVTIPVGNLGSSS